MSKEPLDASVGLAFSLSLFERYRKSGRLQAELHHVPGIRGTCTAYLELVEGKLTTCIVKDSNGQSRPIEKAVLIRVDNERGPFEWKLQPPQGQPPSSPSKQGVSQVDLLIPRAIAPLNLEMMKGWTPHHKLILSTVYNAINGQRTIGEIKQKIPVQANDIEEALRLLHTMHVIATA
jgi:hypothetical protein